MRLRTIALLVGMLALTSSGRADVTSWNCENDNDGAINCAVTYWGEEAGEYLMTIKGNQHWGPGHMIGWFVTDTEVDPTIRIRNIIDNDTGFAWTGYNVNVYMDRDFTLSVAQVYSPGDWTGTILNSGDAVWNGSQNRYEGAINFSGVSAIPDTTGTFDFGYKLTFDGYTSYAFTQEMMPVPEPSTVVLLGLGGLGLFAYRWRRRSSC